MGTAEKNRRPPGPLHPLDHGDHRKNTGLNFSASQKSSYWKLKFQHF